MPNSRNWIALLNCGNGVSVYHHHRNIAFASRSIGISKARLLAMWNCSDIGVGTHLPWLSLSVHTVRVSPQHSSAKPRALRRRAPGRSDCNCQNHFGCGLIATVGEGTWSASVHRVVVLEAVTHRSGNPLTGKRPPSCLYLAPTLISPHYRRPVVAKPGYLVRCGRLCDDLQKPVILAGRLWKQQTLK